MKQYLKNRSFNNYIFLNAPFKVFNRTYNLTKSKLHFEQVILNFSYK